MTPSKTTDFIRAGTLQELKEKGCLVVHGAEHPIAVFFHEGKIDAVDNRCPHMGFPLSRGSVKDGILTCHWHHAQFELSGGCAFDLFTGDVPTARVEVRGEEVFVSARCQIADPAQFYKKQLNEGMAQNIDLVIAKSVIALRRQRTDYRQIVAAAAIFGASHRDGWAAGLTILTALANVIPSLPEEEQFLALYHGISRAAGDCAGQAPRRDRLPLENCSADDATLRKWFRHWIVARRRDGAERTLLTAIQRQMPAADLCDLLIRAATDRAYADGGHALDYVNKACEMLDLIGWEQAAAILPTLARQLAAARGQEEFSSWRHPIDLLTLLGESFQKLPQLFKEGSGKSWSDPIGLAEEIGSDDPHRLIGALEGAIAGGATLPQLSQSLCYAAVLRIAHFGLANEFGDWVTALHTFTYCNALDQSLRRIVAGKRLEPADAAELARGIFHGAVSVYQDRFLNVPPAPLPGEREDLNALPAEADRLLEDFLQTLDTRQRAGAAARLAARYLSLGHDPDRLIVALARGVLREDADFHTYQMLEASVRQFRLWGNTPAGRNILIAAARYVAAHSPTQRSALQTAQIALKLDRGGALHEDS